MVMKSSEILAIENYLNCYDYEASFDVNIEKLQCGNPDIEPIELYKGIDKETLANEISILENNVRVITDESIAFAVMNIYKEKRMYEKQVNLAMTYLMSLLDSADNVKHAPAIIKQMEAIKNGNN